MQKVETALFNYKNNKQWIENLHIVMQIGLTMVGSIIFCFFVGYYLDQWLGTTGVFVAIFTILGVIGGGNVIYRQIMEITNESSKPKPPGDNNNDRNE
ncbi:MAG: AtpZ/AtpI family protein [Thermodesulfobacteriota bacterium]|nr:AtpZ/AtpI family protein [Thermodesulfobacteriota bacterium]